jgi:hypothetical protein
MRGAEIERMRRLRVWLWWRMFAVTITVRQDSGICFKTLARNVEKRGRGRCV